MKHRVVAIVFAAFLLNINPHAASAAGGFLGGSDGLDPAFCKSKSIRQTVVYIDDMMMSDGQTEWATKLANKLKATLIPGERVTVVRLSPATAQSHEYWSGCWPAYTPAERAKLEQGSFADFFRKSPLAQLADQQKFFTRDFGEALSAIYNKSKRSANTARIDPANPPKKEILRALSSDESRFAHSNLTIRAVIYSDLAESSDLGSIYKPLPATPENYGKKLGTYLRRSVFYIFGVGEDINGDSRLQESARGLWASALRSMNATVGGMGVDLSVPNVVPVKAYSYSVQLQYVDGQQLDGRMVLLADADGALVDSWVGISRLTSVMLSGFLKCQEGKGDGECRLDAATSGLVTSNSNEIVALSGTEHTGLAGQVGVKGTSIFPLKTTPTDD